MKLERFDEAKSALAEGERSGVSSDKLDALNQRLQRRDAPSDADMSAQDLTLTGNSKAKSGALVRAPSRDQIHHLIEHYHAGRLEEAEALATFLTQQFPRHPFGWKVLGAAFKQTGRVEASLYPCSQLCSYRHGMPKPATVLSSL